MSMVISNNISAMNTTRNMNKANNNLSGSIEKLSTGYRINSGKDDPSGLVISEQLRAQKAGLERAVQNTSEATNVLSIAEGALNEMNEILKTMKALAIHANNTGVTSSDQIEADQAEMDSAIQTLERIASTTAYSSQNLLNGSMDITYDTNTEVKGTQNNALLSSSSTFEQIYKRDGYSVTIGFTGTQAAGDNNIGTADMTKQAAKAYMEIDTVEGSLSQVDENGDLTQSQSFILTGNKGSRQFSFGSGTNITTIVSAISGYADSTGVDASLTFNSNQEVNKVAAPSTIDCSDANVSYTAGSNTTGVVVSDNFYTDSNGDRQNIMDDVTTTQDFADCIQFGLNTDGQGNMYVKVGANGTYEVYKDSSLSAESLIGVADSTGVVTAQNNSLLEGLTITINADAKQGSVAILNCGNVLLDSDSATGTGIFDATAAAAGTASTFDLETSVAAGVSLGTNTDDSGQIHIKVIANDDGTGTVYAYKDSAMRAEDLVAVSESNISLEAADVVTLNQVWNSEHTASTGLSLSLTVSGDFAEGTTTGTIQFDNLGARIYSTEYGEDAYIQVQQFEGGLFTYYDQQDNANSATLVEAGANGSTKTTRVTGQDATVNVNGQQVKTNGLKLDLATSDLMAKLVFNSGKSGSTTIAQVGYGEGSIFTQNGALTLSSITDNAKGLSALLNNACHTTKETVNHFQGGMQLQLGEGSGDQNRTVVAIKSMSIDNLGRTSITKQFDSGNAVVETKTLSIRDVMGGGIASLSQDAVSAMEIIENAINDVSNLRAQIGAVQTNMLQTNQNNLEVAIENITKTESGIRDTDMASEMTAFTNAQVLANAGVSMLSQANSQAQNVLSLLR